jgi:predicted dehydrogenase
MSDFQVSRRYFFFGSLLSAAVPIAGFGSVASLRAAGYKPFNEKLNIASVGIGGRGAQNLSGLTSENIVALCDVDSRQGAPTFKRYEKAAQYSDFRKMLDNKDIDAVVVSTADHMHATVALWSMQRGKHVYVEKPLSHTPWEAHLLAEAATKYKVATQMGNQGYSHEGQRTACEIVWSGEIGNVTEVHACTTSPNWPQGMQSIPAPEAVPPGLDWDLWLGGAAYRPYTSGGWDKNHIPDGTTGPYTGENYGFYVPHDWRGFYDFGTGSLGDAAIHAFGPANQALQLGSPIAVESVRAEERSKFAYPRRSVLRFDFAARGNMPPVSAYWHEGLRGAESDPKLDYLFYRPKGLENEVLLPVTNNLAALGRPDLGSIGNRSTGGAAGGTGRGGGASDAARAAALATYQASIPKGVLNNDGSIFVGDKGYLATVGRGEGVQLLPAARWKDYTLPAPVLSRSPGHYRDWIRACKGGEQACSNFSVAGPYAEWITLGAIAYRFEGKLEYDPVAKRFTNRPEANQFLKPAFRKGWELTL